MSELSAKDMANLSDAELQGIIDAQTDGFLTRAVRLAKDEQKVRLKQPTEHGSDEIQKEPEPILEETPLAEEVHDETVEPEIQDIPEISAIPPIEEIPEPTTEPIAEPIAEEVVEEDGPEPIIEELESHKPISFESAKEILKELVKEEEKAEPVPEETIPDPSSEPEAVSVEDYGSISFENAETVFENLDLTEDVQAEPEEHVDDDVLKGSVLRAEEPVVQSETYTQTEEPVVDERATEEQPEWVETIKGHNKDTKTESRAGELEVVSPPTRLIHWIVDSIVLFFVWIPVFFFVAFFTMIFDASVMDADDGMDSLVYVAYFIGYFLYHCVMEYKYGKTVGKFATKSRVVMKDGSAPTLKDIIVRTLCRFIPFDTISFIFTPRGFHDWMSSTSVVKDEGVSARRHANTPP